MIVVEFLLVAAHLALKPFKTKGGDVFLTCLAITRFVCTVLMIAFLETLNAKPIPRVVIGVVIAIIFSVSVIVVILNLVLHAVGSLLRRKRGDLVSPASSSNGLVSEKNSVGSKMPSDLEKHMSPDEVSSGDSLDHQDDDDILTDEAGRQRPLNPTPNQSTMLPFIDNSLYPLSPTGTTVSAMDPPTINSSDSGTITIGSLLPRRWSFSFSLPSSPVGSSMGHPSHQASLSPSPLSTPALSSEGGALSRNTSLMLPSRNQHEDIQEEPDVTSLTINTSSSPLLFSTLSSSSEDGSLSRNASLILPSQHQHDDIQEDPDTTSSTITPPLNPLPLSTPASPSEDGALSRNASLMTQIGHQHDDIQENPDTTSSTITASLSPTTPAPSSEDGALSRKASLMTQSGHQHDIQEDPDTTSLTITASLSPPPLSTPASSSEDGALLRNASSTPQSRHQHDDTQEDPDTTSSTITTS